MHACIIAMYDLGGTSYSRGKGCRQTCQSRFLHTSWERLCKLWLFIIRVVGMLFVIDVVGVYYCCTEHRNS